LLLAKLGADVLAWVLGIMFLALAAMLLIEGIREGAVPRDKVIAMLQGGPRTAPAPGQE